MVECGSMDQPPSVQNITIWGIVTFVIMAVLGISSIYGVMEALNFGSFWSIIGLIGSGFGVAGLIFVILAIIQNNGVHMKIGIFCFLISCLINIVLFIIGLIGLMNADGKAHFHAGNLLTLLLDIFLCYLFYRQSSGFSPGA